MTEAQKTAKSERRRELETQLRWVTCHPQHFDPNQRDATIDFLKGSIAELDRPEEIKNDRPGRRPRVNRLRDRLRTLLTVILTQSTAVRK